VNIPLAVLKDIKPIESVKKTEILLKTEKVRREKPVLEVNKHSIPEKKENIFDIKTENQEKRNIIKIDTQCIESKLIKILDLNGNPNDDKIKKKKKEKKMLDNNVISNNVNNTQFLSQS